MGIEGYKSKPIFRHQTPECLGVWPQQKPVYDKRSEYNTGQCALLLAEEMKDQAEDIQVKDGGNQTVGF